MATSNAKTLDTNAGSPNSWRPQTSEERAAVREQLERILASPLFCNSRRYPNLLRFTVLRAIEGNNDHLKERTLGIEVFGREPDYDTNLDPVVRITAVEVRKRIAQYYREPGREFELRIDFPSGSYMPEFHMPTASRIVKMAVVEAAPHEAPLVPSLAVPAAIPARAVRLPPQIFSQRTGLFCLTSLLLVATLLYKPWVRTDVLHEFWRPILTAPGEVLVVVGGRPPGTQAAGGPVVTDPASATPVSERIPPMSVVELQRADQLAFGDASTMAMLAGLFRSSNKRWRVRRTWSTKLADLRDGPVVMIGAFNNSWTLRLTSQLRFYFAHKASGESIIVDRQNPSQKWTVDGSIPFTSLAEDYALISRVLDSTTGHQVVIAAGITKYGTTAAGEFLTDSSYMEALSRVAPRDWKGKNVQVVIGAKVIGESSGPPNVLAACFW